MLNSISLSENLAGRLTTQLFGGLEIVGGAIELVGAAGLLLAPDPTTATKVGGAILGANGVDNAVAGGIALWTGRPRSTLTARGAAAAARSLGLDAGSADTAGIVLDIAVPLVTAGVLGAARAIAVRSGIIDLVVEEAAGGHTIAEHVGKDIKYLSDRLAKYPRLRAASTFRNLADAEKYISRAINANANKIDAWAKAPNPARTFAFDYDAKELVGTVLLRSTGALQKTTKVNIVFRKTTVANKVYFLLTAYPIP
jgi:hypothetical protein